MSERENPLSAGGYGKQLSIHSMPSDAAIESMRKAAASVMAIQDMTLGDVRSPLRIRGKLTTDSEKAFNILRPQFEAVGHTPILRREEGMEVIKAIPVVFGRERTRPPRMAIILLILTIISVFYIGMGHSDSLYLDPLIVLVYQITGSLEKAVSLFGMPELASHPELLPTPEAWRSAMETGALYVLALLGILGTHEMGHYLMSRYHKIHTTLPFFIPLPLPPLGTMGAVIAMREPAPNRRVQFDIGIAGPLSGLIVAIPVMVIGLMLSRVESTSEFLSTIPEVLRGNLSIIHEGQSLLYLGLKYLIFGRVLPSGDMDVWIHPVAFAAWAGFLVTSLNLLPIGQLDGGHITYGLFGEKVQRLRMPVVIVLGILAVAGTLSDMGIVNLGFGWSSWWLWLVMIFVLFRNHATVLDDITELDQKRKVLGIIMLIVFLLIFMPTPLAIDMPPETWIMRGFFG
jgi:hypothetical protein